ncbi:hypothetical protein ATHL_03471 [Anaerolinea thermolimosa]|uniref:Uncharacterized protein n=1 Tax=Anaerolinea thermolimosa TaxID=229919 RepID=A0A7U9KQA8_9CHLR|nr:hypothetical protein [Anaerolinea thermolimosa]GAP08566.1 hypothetical protein ATHL_03471 [Anaerolinea thermolimosa]
MNNTEELPYEAICALCGQLFEMEKRPEPSVLYACKDCTPPKEEDFSGFLELGDLDDPSESDDLEK